MARARNKLTAKNVQLAKAKEKNYRLSDGGGLYLNVRSKAGGVDSAEVNKSFEFRYTKPQTGKTTYIGFGSYPDVSLKEAREKAYEARKLLSEGIDPLAVKAQKIATKTEEEFNTFGGVAELWKESKRNSNKENTIKGNWRKLELYAFPKLKNIPVAKITAPLAIQALRPVENNGRLETVKRTAQLMNEVMTFAVNYGLIHSNPLSGIKEVFKQPKVQHLYALKPEEITELLQALSSANIQLTTRCLIEFQLHTMVRPGEASAARWSEIDFDRNIWLIPEQRMKATRPHAVPLTTQVLAILEVIKPISGRREYIFPSIRDPKRSTHRDTINCALGRMGLKGRTTAHGFRSLASTTLNENGFDPDVIEAALSHADRNQIRAAYNRTTYLSKRREMMEWWSSYIEKASYGSLSVTGHSWLKKD